ncbi:unnamed protein product [Microthlaspi erraticum]|uniref:Uncharacterized protein n=1 Tax=Microthlaspi erraticum TaxID=1685480 RepID=A0A6D2I105_9BRAS|nr:unnamed protein product [Microthlaspi erraticum]
MCCCLNDIMSLPPATDEMLVQEDNNSSSSSLSFSSLPKDMVLKCLLRVPRSSHLNVSFVNASFKSLITSREFHQSQSILLRKDSVYVSFTDDEEYDCVYKWFTLRPVEIEDEKKTTEYRLVPVPVPSNGLSYVSAEVIAVGSEIYFVGGETLSDSDYDSSGLWIYDTLSGDLTKGPSMPCPNTICYALGVVEGEIYVIRGGREYGEIQVVAFDTKSRVWSFAWEGNVQKPPSYCASLEGKVYTVDHYGDEVTVYNPKEGKTEETISTIENEGRIRRGDDFLSYVCAVEDVLYACFDWSGFVWFDNKLNVWTRLIISDDDVDDVKALTNQIYVDAMVEYHGKLAVFWQKESEVGEFKDVMCVLIALDRIGERIRGKIDWSGVVATVPTCYKFVHCLGVSH